jgi:hypothetical protein
MIREWRRELHDERRENGPIHVTTMKERTTLNFVIPSVAEGPAVLLIPNEGWVPHSSRVFGLEWDTQHSTRSSPPHPQNNFKAFR